MKINPTVAAKYHFIFDADYQPTVSRRPVRIDTRKRRILRHFLRFVDSGMFPGFRLSSEIEQSFFAFQTYGANSLTRDEFVAFLQGFPDLTPEEKNRYFNRI